MSLMTQKLRIVKQRTKLAYGWCAEVTEGEWLEHRLYVSEVIELSSEVSVIVLLPAAQNICCAPCNVDIHHGSTAYVPLQIFEISEPSRRLINCNSNTAETSKCVVPVSTYCAAVRLAIAYCVAQPET